MEEKQDKVSNLHPRYDAFKRMRAIVKDVRSGTLALRAAKDKYLPKFPEELQATYENRANCSTLFNLYAKTEAVMKGLVFQREIVLGADVPPQIKTLAENIDNRGNHLNVFAQKTFENFFLGAGIILVDAPPVEGVISLEDERLLGLRPYWVNYEPDDVINWRYRVNPVTKKTELSLIVFKEITDEVKGRFLTETVTRYRVFYLDEIGRPAWELWREIKDKNNLKEAELIREGGGTLERLSAIPVAIAGSLEQKPAMLDLALLNIKHFQKQSNFDNLETQAAVPLFYTKGLQKAAGETLPVGTDIHYELPTDGDIGWAQLDASGFDSMRASLDHVVGEMTILGLSMLADKTARVDVTATEALLNSIGETAELRVMAEQLKDALELALGFTAEYLGLGKDAGGSIELGAAWTRAEIAADTSQAPAQPKAGA